ncbi:MAG: CBASS cGAMP-activated phospholipase [Nitrospirota bacterium]
MSSFQILALDGGGIKGLFSAAVLTHLEEDLQINVTDYFDLIVGTSTGGIIALGLGIGMRPHAVVSFYVKKGPEIFPHGIGIGIRQFWQNKFYASPLENALKECFKDKLLGESKKRLVIPSYNLGDDDVYLFKTAHHERLTRDYKVPIWKVALATSAAPTYFPTFHGINHIRLIDGGIWANNPTMVGIVEAVSMLGQALDSIKVLSLGTTDEIKIRADKLDKGGFWQWKKAALDVFLRAQNIGTFTQAQHLLSKDKVIRLNPKVPDGLFKMDKLSEKELLSKAAHESRHFAPQFKEVFMNHKAHEFKPFHK